MDAFLATILPFAATYAPQGWADCVGQTISIQQYTALFALLGTTYGGDGRTTFGIPDLRGRVIVGQGQGPGLANYVQGQRAGSENVTLTAAQLPAHSHGATQAASTVSGGSVSGLTLAVSQATSGHETPQPGEYLAAMIAGGGENVSAYIAAASRGYTVPLGGLSGGSISGATVANGAITIASTGNNQPHPNLQPYLVLRYIICIQGLFPPRS